MTEENIIVGEEPIAEQPLVGEGYNFSGIDGSFSEEAMNDRLKRQKSFMDRRDYHAVVPCNKCCACLAIKGFTIEGRLENRGYVCTTGEFPTDEMHTCSDGRRTKRIRVVYDMTNAPAGYVLNRNFMILSGQGANRQKGIDEDNAGKSRETAPREGYRGGSEYAPKYGEGGKMPGGLMN